MWQLLHVWHKIQMKNNNLEYVTLALCTTELKVIDGFRGKHGVILTLNLNKIKGSFVM